MLNHYGGRDAPALPVVDSLQHASIGREAKQLGKSGIPTGCGDEVACFDGCHSRDCKHSVYAMSNSLCTTDLNRPFIIRTVVTSVRQVAQQIQSDRETKKKPRPGSPDQPRSS